MTALTIQPKISDLPATVTKGLTNTEIGYISLSEGKRIIQHTENELYEFTENGTRGVLADIVKTVYTYAGQAPEPDDFRTLVQAFYNELTKMNNHTSIDDIREALRLGVLGKLVTEENPTGKYFGINLKTFFDWINIYLFQKERAEALLKKADLIKKSLEPPKKLTREELNKIDDECVQTCLDHWKKTGEIVNLGNAVFKTLWKQGKIRFDEKKKAELIDQARKQVTAELIEKRQKAKDRLSKSEVTKVEIEMMEIEEDENTRVAITAGSIAIREYFNKL